MTPPSGRRISRREALLWIAALASAGTVGACGVGGLIATLWARRQGAAAPSLTPADPRATVATHTPVLATLAPPPMVNRAAWGARPVNHAAENEYGYATPENPDGWYVYPAGDLAAIYQTVAIHHSYPVPRDSGTMPEIQDIHLDLDKWADIGYHYGIGGDGTLYEGRDIGVRGASVAGHNTGTIGVVVIGDFEREVPSMAQLRTLQDLLLYLKVTYTLTHLAGHYEFNADTVCPGANMRFHLDTLAASAGLLRGTDGYVPPTATPTAP